MTEIKYDPELPYAFIGSNSKVYARFSERELAHRYGKEVQVGSVVDTTPKPKIPEDANYVFVEDGDQSVFAYRIVFPDGRNGWMMVGNGPISEEDLLELYIGDELVTVMVEKEDA